MALKVFLVILGCFSVAYVNAQTASYACFSSGANGVIAKFRLKRDGVTTITDLTAYDQAGDTATTCTTNTVVSDVFTLDVLFDMTSSPIECGVEQDGSTTSYKIRVHAINSAAGDQPYNIACDTSLLTDDTVSAGPLTVAGSMPVFSVYEQGGRSIRMQAVLSGVNMPVSTVKLGRQIKLQIIYNKGSGASSAFGPSTWGKNYHVGFLRTEATAELSVDIYTPGRGTSVKITGQLAVGEIDETVVVTRDSPIQVILPTAYQPTGTATLYPIEVKGIELEGIEDIIAVRVNSVKTGGYTDSYVAYPDEVLGEVGTNLYRLPTMYVAGATAQAIVVATQAGTDVTLNADGYTSLPGSFTTNPVTLNAYETLHLFCGYSCEEFSVTSTKPVAVISGNGQDTDRTAGHVMAQMLPTSTFGNRFVIVKFPDTLAYEVNYKVLTETATHTTTGANLWQRGVTMTYLLDGSLPLNFFSSDSNWDADELMAPAGVFASVTQFPSGVVGSIGPGMMNIPPVQQWATEYTVPLHSNTDVTIVVITTHGYIGNITFQMNTELASEAVALDPLYAQVVNSPAGAQNFDFTIANGVVDDDETWVKFKTLDPTKPFAVYVYEVSQDGSLQAFAAFGEKATKVNPCLAETLLDPDTPIYPGVKKGDGVNNDCDSAEGEEINNGLDDDGDTLIDEDLAANGTSAVNAKAIHNILLQMDSENTFTGSTDVIVDGCNEDVNSNMIGSIGHFKEAADNGEYPHYWTLETKDFPAFRLVNQAPVWFFATADFCIEETGLCLDSCPAQTTRKRRGISFDKPTTAVLQLNVIDEETVIPDTKVFDGNSCMKNAMYWSVLALLIFIIIFEICVVAIFVRKRYMLYTD